MKGQLRIDKIFAFTCIDEDGTEGIIGMTTPDGASMPLIGADRERIESLRPYARMIAKARGIRIILSQYSAREDLEVIDESTVH